MRYLTPLLILLLLVFASCNKGDADSPSPTEKEQLLTAKPWKLVSVMYNNDDLFLGYPSCLKDDLYIYEIDGTYKVDDGNEKCSDNSPQIRTTSTWKFMDNETKLIFHDGAVIDVVTLTSTQLTIITPKQENIITYTNQ